MRLICYPTGGPLDIRPAPLERDWMDATGERFAYRCLPLNIANAHGWEILCPSGFTASWNGGTGGDAISIEPDPGTRAPAVSHFGHGVLTFHVLCVFETDPGVDLMVQGPINRPKDSIAALAGVIETDWSPYTFTMNWLFTRPNAAVRFAMGEPYCHVFPIRRGELERIEPQLRDLSANRELKRHFETWIAGRNKFNADLKQAGTPAQSAKWQKLYYRGQQPDGNPAEVKDHRTRIRLRPFTR